MKFRIRLSMCCYHFQGIMERKKRLTKERKDERIAVQLCVHAKYSSSSLAISRIP